MTNADAASIRRRARRATGQFSALVDQPQEPSSGTIWYYSVNGETYGPYSEQELIDRFGDGRVGDEAYVWNESMLDWKAAVEEPLFVGLIEKANDERSDSKGRFRTTSLSIADQLVGEVSNEKDGDDADDSAAAGSETESDASESADRETNTSTSGEVDFGWQDSAATTKGTRAPRRATRTKEVATAKQKPANLTDPDLQAALNSEAFEDAMGEALDQMFSGNFEAVPDNADGSDDADHSDTPTLNVASEDEPGEQQPGKRTATTAASSGGLRPSEGGGDTVSRLKAKLNARRARRQTGSMPAITPADLTPIERPKRASEEPAATTPDWGAITSATGETADDLSSAAETSPDWDAITAVTEPSSDAADTPGLLDVDAHAKSSDDVSDANTEEVSDERPAVTDALDEDTSDETAADETAADETAADEASDTEDSFPATATPPPFIARTPAAKTESTDDDTESVVAEDDDETAQTDPASVLERDGEDDELAGSGLADDADSALADGDEDLDEFEMLAMDLTGTGFGEATAANAIVAPTDTTNERDERMGNILLVALIFGLLIGIGTLANAMWGSSPDTIEQTDEEPIGSSATQHENSSGVRAALTERQLENLEIASRNAGNRIQEALNLAVGEAEYAANRASEQSNGGGRSSAGGYNTAQHQNGANGATRVAPGIPSLPGINTGSYLAERSPQTVIQSGTEQFIRTVVRMCENQVRGLGGVNMSNVRVTLRVRPTGEVEAISLNPGRARSPAFYDCVIRRGTNHRFAPFEGATQTVNLRNITLTP